MNLNHNVNTRCETEWSEYVLAPNVSTAESIQEETINFDLCKQSLTRTWKKIEDGRTMRLCVIGDWVRS